MYLSKSCCVRTGNFLPALLVHGIAIYEYINFFRFYILSMLTDSSNNIAFKLFFICEFHCCFILFVISYWRCSFNDPGYVDEKINDLFPNFQEIREKNMQILENNKILQTNRNRSVDASTALLENKSQMNYQSIRIDLSSLKEDSSIMEFNPFEHSFCFKCNRVKPPRAHHCRICKRCIMRMDHHCPWTTNCIGVKNQKFFFLFLLYSVMSLFNICLCMWNKTLDLLFIQKTIDAAEAIHILLTEVLAFTFMIAIFFLLCFNIFLMWKNVTTIEIHFPEILKNNPFSTNSILHNFKEILGDRIILWLLPVSACSKQEITSSRLN